MLQLLGCLSEDFDRILNLFFLGIDDRQYQGRFSLLENGLNCPFLKIDDCWPVVLGNPFFERLGCNFIQR